jgi:hypothetical protein
VSVERVESATEESPSKHRPRRYHGRNVRKRER